jgi:uncharacterized protein (DUF433 family)
MATSNAPPSERLPVTRNPAVLGGAPVFAGTRVLARTLIDYLEAGNTIDCFLADFPTVTRDQVLTYLEEAHRALTPDPV